MRVARVTVRAPITSFRHPFFVTGTQPTALFPPPSTIHGHCASALGHWPDPATFFFGLWFTFRSRGRDLEHQHITVALGAKAKTRVRTADGEVRATTEITVQPVSRDFLFDTTLVLYLAPDVGDAFRRPTFTMALGRSQDLAEVERVDDVTLERPQRARIEHTLLPQRVRPCVRFGPTVLLSRRIGEPPQRDATFAQYIALHEPVFFNEPESARAFTRVDGIPLDDLWCDPTEVDAEGRPRGVWLHRLDGPAQVPFANVASR